MHIMEDFQPSEITSKHGKKKPNKNSLQSSDVGWEDLNIAKENAFFICNKKD